MPLVHTVTVTVWLSVRALSRRVLSVGRLDVNTSGLLLLTNCGQLKQVSRAMWHAAREAAADMTRSAAGA